MALLSTGLLDSSLQRLARQRWLRFGVRDRVVRRFAPPDRGVSNTFETDFFGLRYRGDLKSFIDWSIYYYGAYCREELDLLRNLLTAKPGSVFLDVGANVGQHSLFASQYASAVHSFEPYPPVATQFAANVDLNRLKNITIHQIGLGSRDATLAYSAPATGNLGTGTFSLTANKGEQLTLQVRNGDAYLRKLGLTTVDVIKIDTEGFEIEVLRGLVETMKAFRPVVFLEWTPQKHEGVEVNPLTLFPEGYGLRRFCPEQVVGVFFRRRSYALRAFTSLNEANYVAAPHEVFGSL